jgi:hypothetical protein
MENRWANAWVIFCGCAIVAAIDLTAFLLLLIPVGAITLYEVGKAHGRRER